MIHSLRIAVPVALMACSFATFAIDSSSVASSDAEVQLKNPLQEGHELVWCCQHTATLHKVFSNIPSTDSGFLHNLHLDTNSCKKLTGNANTVMSETYSRKHLNGSADTTGIIVAATCNTVNVQCAWKPDNQCESYYNSNTA